MCTDVPIILLSERVIKSWKSFMVEKKKAASSAITEVTVAGLTTEVWMDALWGHFIQSLMLNISHSRQFSFTEINEEDGDKRVQAKEE